MTGWQFLHGGTTPLSLSNPVPSLQTALSFSSNIRTLDMWRPPLLLEIKDRRSYRRSGLQGTARRDPSIHITIDKFSQLQGTLIHPPTGAEQPSRWKGVDWFAVLKSHGLYPCCRDFEADSCHFGPPLWLVSMLQLVIVTATQFSIISLNTGIRDIAFSAGVIIILHVTPTNFDGILRFLRLLPWSSAFSQAIIHCTQKCPV